jgi:bifunctional enzyme CysN/CysC
VAHAGHSVTLTLEDEIDISRGDMIAMGDIEVGQQFRADVVWMDERPLDPGRVYLLKHTTRTVSAEVDHPLVLNQIGSVTVSTTRPLIFDRYVDNRGTGSFILIDRSTNFTAGAGMIADGVRSRSGRIAKPTAAERLARVARAAGSDAEAIEAVRKALEELLS